jgi:putative membrane protein
VRSIDVVIRIVARVVLSLLANAIGLIVAAWVLSDMWLDAGGFVIAVAIFTGLTIVTQPLLVKISLQQAPALSGSSALLSVLIALVVTDIVSSGLEIRGVVTWIAATVIVWIVSLLGGLLLPLVIFKKALGRDRSNAGRR